MVGAALTTVLLPGAIALGVMLVSRVSLTLRRAAPALTLGVTGGLGTCLVLGRVPPVPGRVGEDWLPLLFAIAGLLGSYAALARRPGPSRLLPLVLAALLLAMPLANAWKGWPALSIAFAWVAGMAIAGLPAWALGLLARRERTRLASEWCMLASSLAGAAGLFLAYTGKYAQISLLLAMVAGASILTRAKRPIGGGGTHLPRREGSASTPAVLAPFHACLVLMGCFYADLYWGAAGLLLLAPLGAATGPRRGILVSTLACLAANGVQWAAR